MGLYFLATKGTNITHSEHNSQIPGVSEKRTPKKEKETFRIEFSTKRRKKTNLTPNTNRLGTSSTVTTLPHLFVFFLLENNPNSPSLSLSPSPVFFFRFSSNSTSQLSLCVLGLSASASASACDFGNLSLVICVSPERERERMMEETKLLQWSVIRSLLAILQWWAFNVTVIIMNKWIFQVLLHFSCCQLLFVRFRFFFPFLLRFFMRVCFYFSIWTVSVLWIQCFKYRHRRRHFTCQYTVS